MTFFEKRKITHWPHKYFSIYKITLLSTQRKGWLTKTEEESALFVYLCLLVYSWPSSPPPGQAGRDAEDPPGANRWAVQAGRQEVSPLLPLQHRWRRWDVAGGAEHAARDDMAASQAHTVNADTFLFHDNPSREITDIDTKQLQLECVK